MAATRLRSELLTWANAITALRVVGIVALVFADSRPPPPYALPLFVFLFWICDSLDGWVARLLRQQSALGGALDLTADRALDLFCGIWLLHRGVEATDAALISAYLLTRFAFEPLVFGAIADARQLGSRWLRRLALEYSAASKAAYFGVLILVCSDSACSPVGLGLLRVAMVALTLGYAAHVVHVLNAAWRRSR